MDADGKPEAQFICLKRLVGERGFEPPTPWSRTRCSTRLSHSPTKSRACAREGGKRSAHRPRNTATDCNYNIQCPPARSLQAKPFMRPQVRQKGKTAAVRGNIV